MSKINKKVLSLILVISSSLSLSACQLAKEESDYKETENLCGAFITYEREGEDYVYKDREKKYYGKFDEELIEKDIDKYNFGNLDGYAFFLHEEGDGDNRVKGLMADKVFQDSHLSVNVNTEDNTKEIITTDDEALPEPDINVTSEENKISATMYVTSKFKGIVKVNPIIKEGKKYYTVLEGNSMHISGENPGASSISGSSDSKTTNYSNNNSESKSEKFSYTITVDVVDELKSVRVKEMSSDDTLINKKDIVHENGDYEFKMGANTAYVIVEETCIDGNGKEVVKRSVYDRDEIDEDTNHICYYANEDGIVIPKNLYIKK